MKHSLFREGESGQALVLALIMLCVGSIIVAPLVSLIDTGLGATEIREEDMQEFYAVNAGMDDALNKIRLDTMLENYTLAEIVNNKSVDIAFEDTWLLEGLETQITPPTEDEIVVMGSTIEIDSSERWYRLDLSCHQEPLKTLPVDKVAVWLPAEFEYVANSTIGITTTNPTQVAHHGGTVLEWNFSPAVNFVDLPITGGGIPPTQIPVRRALAFKFTPGKDPLGAFPWLTTTDISNPLYWDEACESYKIIVTSTDIITSEQAQAESYVSKSRLSNRVNCTYGDYRAIGNTLMRDDDGDEWHIRETFFNESSATISKGTEWTTDRGILPPDATILAAYLYWSAWRDDEGVADTQVTFKINDGDAIEVVAGTSAVDPNTYGFSYACSADVTSLVGEIDSGGDGDSYVITVGDVYGETDNQWSYAGWSVIFIYSSPSENAHQLYLYDTFTYVDNADRITFTLDGFTAPSDSSGNYLTYFVGDGDGFYGAGAYDWYSIPNYGINDWEYITVNGDGNYLSDPGDDPNPWNNLMNEQSNGLGQSAGDIDGVDIDTFDISSYITEGDTSAEVKFGTGVDSWNIIYVILSFRSVVVEEWQPYPVGIITYDGG